MRISWIAKKPNQEVMEMAGYKRFLLKTIRKRQLQFCGHINRADGLETQILSGKICGTKSRGRQLTKCTDSLNNLVTREKSPNNELIRGNDDREDWMAHDDDIDDINAFISFFYLKEEILGYVNLIFLKKKINVFCKMAHRILWQKQDGKTWLIHSAQAQRHIFWGG